jgi:hypothetical protein
MARIRWPPGREPWPLAQARQHRDGTAGGCQKNLGPADRSFPKTTSGVSRLAGQAGTQATDPTPEPGRIRESRAGNTHPHPPCRLGTRKNCAEYVLVRTPDNQFCVPSWDPAARGSPRRSSWVTRHGRARSSPSLMASGQACIDPPSGRVCSASTMSQGMRCGRTDDAGQAPGPGPPRLSAGTRGLAPVRGGGQQAQGPGARDGLGAPVTPVVQPVIKRERREQGGRSGPHAGLRYGARLEIDRR